MKIHEYQGKKILKSYDIHIQDGVDIDSKQDIEGEIVSLIQECRNKYSGLIINAAGYTHTSVSILDALMVLKIPIIELHITNIYNREEFRHKSLVSKAATGIICGFGVKGYIMALEAIKNFLKNEN